MDVNGKIRGDPLRQHQLTWVLSGAVYEPSLHVHNLPTECRCVGWTGSCVYVRLWRNSKASCVNCMNLSLLHSYFHCQVGRFILCGKDAPAVQETTRGVVQSVQEDPLEWGQHWQPTPKAKMYLEIPWTEEPGWGTGHGVYKESDKG